MGAITDWASVLGCSNLMCNSKDVIVVTEPEGQNHKPEVVDTTKYFSMLLIISCMETLLQSISNCFNFRRLKRYIRKHLYAYPQQGRYVTLTTLKSTKTISLDVEENLKERASKHHKDQTDTFDIEEKFNEFAKKLDLVVDQLTALKNQQRNNFSQ